jgi:hypothetical protein
MSPREPARIVTEPFPHVRLADAFGPALRFWHGCALTAWFLCEGPSSRTDMAGLKDYHRRDLAELEDLGTPVDRDTFAELVAAERRLGRTRAYLHREQGGGGRTRLGNRNQYVQRLSQGRLREAQRHSL